MKKCDLHSEVMDERDGSARRVLQVDSPRASSLVPSSYFFPSMMMMMMMLFRGGAPKARLCVQFHDFIPRHYLWRGAMIKLTTAPFSFCVCERESARAQVSPSTIPRRRVALWHHSGPSGSVVVVTAAAFSDWRTLTSSRVSTDRKSTNHHVHRYSPSHS